MQFWFSLTEKIPQFGACCCPEVVPISERLRTKLGAAEHSVSLHAKNASYVAVQMLQEVRETGEAEPHSTRFCQVVAQYNTFQNFFMERLASMLLLFHLILQRRLETVFRHR